MDGLLVLVGVLALALAVGGWWRLRTGRVRPVRMPPGEDGPRGTGGTPTEAHLTALGVDPAAADVTLLQFSSAFCAPCRATRRVLGEVAALVPGVRHVEVDAESHLDAVRAFDVRSTPTTLLLDRSGRVVNRAVGAPRKADVVAAVATHLDR